MGGLLGLGTLLVGVGTIATVIIGIIALLNKDAKAANRIAAAAVDQSTRENDLEVMKETIDTLRVNLAEAQVEATALRADLVEARRETQNLRDETTAALANVSVLTDHIHEHVPSSIPFPRLRRVGT